MFVVDPRTVLHASVVHACDLFTDESGTRSLAKTMDAAGVSIPSRCLHPAADGIRLDDSKDPKGGVQMRVLKRGSPHTGKIVPVFPLHAFDQPVYTLWLRHPAGGVAEIVTLTRDEIAPVHSPFACRGFPPTCVRSPTQCGIVVPPVSQNGENGDAYDPDTGKVCVDVDDRTQAMVRTTKAFTCLEGHRAAVLKELLDLDKGRRRTIHAPWYLSLIHI